jgi:predicted GH43/DUF377 family glycosyl hydrolase
MVKREYKELFTRHVDNPILTSADLPYAANTVFNPAATLINGETLLLLRVEDRRGISHLTSARSTNGIDNWQIDPEPTLCPSPETHPEEVWGIEDPRITYVEERGEWFVAYTYRPVPSASLGAHIWISFSPDLKHWGDHQILLWARQGAWWDANKIGLSPQPLRTDRGWLILYHGVRTTAAGCLYRLGFALLDLDDPTKVLQRSSEWVFAPIETYERTGDVADVVFPCGWTLVGDEVRIYYGAADTSIALATAKLESILDWLEEHHMDDETPAP